MQPLIKLWPEMEYKNYQKSGIRWLINQEVGGILADEMGLGKTIQLLGVLKNAPVKKTLLVAPLAVLGQWKEAALRSGLKVQEYEKGSWLSKKSDSSSQLFIINYEKLKSLPKSYYKWDYVICDEAHKLRNRGVPYHVLKEFDFKKIYFLSGTPIVNSTDDIIAFQTLLKIDKQLIYKHTLARSRADVDAKREASYAKVSGRISNILRGFLPDSAVNIITKMAGISKITSEVTIKILEFSTDEENEFYQGVQGTIVKRWKALDSDDNSAMLVLLMRLRQLSIHPQVYISSKKKRSPGYEREDWLKTSTKFEESLRLINEESDEHNWILFCNFKEEIVLLQTFFEMSGFAGKIHSYHGSMSSSEREAQIEASKESGIQHIFLVQIQAGGTGLNLQHFSRAIFMSPCWTSATMDQAAGRLLRIGQLKHVKLYHLLLEGEVGINIDRKMRTAVDKKKALLDDFLAMALH